LLVIFILLSFSLVFVDENSEHFSLVLVDENSEHFSLVLVIFKSPSYSHIKLLSFPSQAQGPPLSYNCIIVKLAVLKLWIQLVSRYRSPSICLQLNSNELNVNN